MTQFCSLYIKNIKKNSQSKLFMMITMTYFLFYLKIFKDIKEKLQKDLNNIKPFLPANHINSIYSKSIIFLMMSLFLQIFILY